MTRAGALPPPPARVEGPSVGSRVALGVLLFIGLVALLVVLPYELISRLGRLGVTSGLPLLALMAGGVALAVLSTVAFVVKPSRAYGPCSMARNLAGVVYLLSFAPFGSFSVRFMSVGITVTYAELLLLALLIPLFGLAASIVTTIEDARRPNERRTIDFPVDWSQPTRVRGGATQPSR